MSWTVSLSWTWDGVFRASMNQPDGGRRVEHRSDDRGEVKFTEWTSEDEMRHPAFLGLRVPNPQCFPLGELQVTALRYICEGLCQ
jgi:ATP-dependent DNA ligase